MFRLTFLLLTATLLSSACTGSQGPSGPVGAEGAQGSQGTTGQTGAAGQNGSNGVTGPAGQTGTTGTPGSQGTPGPGGTPGTPGPIGTANVRQYTFGSRTANGQTKDSSDFSVYLVPGITEEQLDSSVVLVYAKLVTPSWVAIPSIDDSYIFERSLQYDDGGGGRMFVVPRISKANAGVKEPPPRIIFALRIIVIPASIITPLSLHGPDLNDYNAVKAYYHLSD